VLRVDDYQSATYTVYISLPVGHDSHDEPLKYCPALQPVVSSTHEVAPADDDWPEAQAVQAEAALPE
jgi:hypothetical protein